MLNIVLVATFPIKTAGDSRDEINTNTMMVSTRSPKGMLATLLCVSWTVGLVASTSMDGVAHNNSRSHDHGLRDAMARTSSLGESDNHMLNELKEVVMFLSQKIDDSDVSIRALEDKVRTQDATIKSLKTEIGEATSFHRYLQSDDSDCLPQFRNTTFGPRCDFPFVTRFQNRTFFNDDVVFNENVEFDSDANCMPTFNSTTRMCRMNNNYTFDEGDVTFDYNVRFDEDVRFNDDVRFRDLVRMESDVQFNNGGEVTFNKDTKFTENVLIKNEDHDIEFKLEDKVTARFYQDTTFKVDTHTTFYQNVDMEKNLGIDGKLKVEKLTELDDLELYGYLWVDGQTRLDGELKANHRANVKGGLTVETGGLTVSREGASITGTTKVSGTFNLEGQGNAKRNFNVDGMLKATEAVIDNSSNRRNLQQTVNALHDVSTPALRVIGDADVHGSLEADKIRSDDINYNQMDMDHIISQVRIDLRNGDLIVGDVEIVNNSGQRESVLTESRMLQIMNVMDMTVNSITANRATIGSESVPRSPMSSADVVRLLEDQSLRLASLITDTAVIDGIQFQHSDGSSMTSREVLNLLRGESLEVHSIDTNTAIIGGQPYSPSSSNEPDINEIIRLLKTFSGKVLIPKLASYEIDVMDDPRVDAFGQLINPGPGSIEINGEEVVTKREIVRLSNRIEEVNDSIIRQPRVAEVSTTQLLEALDGSSLSVYSLDTTIMTKSGTEVASMDDVGFMIGDAQAMTDSVEASCSCSANDIEAVVTTNFVRDKVDESYVKGMGFATETDLSEYDFSSDCTCGASDVQTHVDQNFLEGLGVSFGTPECSCSSDFVENVIDKNYIRDVVDDLDVAYGNVEATCTCSSADIEAVVTHDYIAGKGFVDDTSECSCSIEESQIKGIVNMEYIEDFGFTTCPCTDGVP